MIIDCPVGIYVFSEINFRNYLVKKNIYSFNFFTNLGGVYGFL